MKHVLSENTRQLQIQNDHFRVTVLTGCTTGGKAFTTRAFSLQPKALRIEVMDSVCNFSNWTTEPAELDYEEHDYGSLACQGNNYFFKIDYYSDETCHWASDDPTNPTKTFRILTIGLQADY